ncbi:MAG: two-component system response regulator [Acidobacteria bacterium CG_4_9_14_3_um_filter_49_7]|nr:MAG: two-component system response regulator [Acidobacteria bacterium CG_4_9_14_3_um_filter_49_7]
MSFRILVVDDETAQRSVLSRFLESEGYTVDQAESAEKALRQLENESVDLIISDMKMAGMSGLELLKQVREKNPLIPFLMITAFSNVSDAVDVLKSGASDYLTKPVNLSELSIRLTKELDRKVIMEENRNLREEVLAHSTGETMVTSSPRMNSILNTAARAARTDVPVLILGESGTGKELLARTIHSLSPRRPKPFVPVNCASLNVGVLESELFGHEKGAFTGAASVRTGRFETASGGSLFLDEIGDVPMEVQVKLLRVLQEKEIERVGGNKRVPVDFRLICATNRSLEEAMENGQFREDLFYRINVVTLSIPPLRERKEDLPGLIEHFLKSWTHQYGISVQGFSPQVYRKLLQYNYPGNIRQLNNIIQRAVVLSRGDSIDSIELEIPESDAKRDWEMFGTLPEAVSNLERQMILQALEESNGVQLRAAKALGISERNLRYKMEKHKIQGRGDRKR